MLSAEETERAHRVWTDPAGAIRIRLDLTLGAAVVRVYTRLDRDALRPCRAALDDALAIAAQGVVIDLLGLPEATPVTVAFLGCIRRYVHARGATLILAAAPPALHTLMDHAHVSPLYTFRPNAIAALGTLRCLTPATPGPSRPADEPGGVDVPEDGVAACCVDCLDCPSGGSRIRPGRGRRRTRATG